MHYLEAFRITLLGRLFKFVFLNYDFVELERLITALSYSVLLVVSVFNEFKFKRRALLLIERLKARLDFKALVVFESSNTGCYYYSGDCRRVTINCLCVGALFLNALVSVAATQSVELLATHCENTQPRCNLRPLLPLRLHASNVLLCVYNAAVTVYRGVVASINNRILFYRIRALLFRFKCESTQNDLIEYRLALCEFVPLVTLSLTSFVCIGAINVHKSVVLQLALSGERLFKLICFKCALTKLELCQKLELSEIEGKVFIRALGFASVALDLKTGAYSCLFRAVYNRLNFVIKVLLCWLELSACARAFVFVIFNYPSSDSRIGNGVGLDTIASVVNIHNLLVRQRFLTRAALVNELLFGVTNYSNLNRITRVTMCLRARASEVSDVVTTRLWGKARVDPFVVNEFSSLSVYRVARSYVMVQPTRGYGLVNPSIYHSAFVVPCRFYWTSYVLCERVCADALLINVGKHGSLEWLPGRANVLSRSCYPELVGLGKPNLYLYIMNNPGEGTQAKRRISSVIVDHFLPPLRALSEPGCAGNSHSLQQRLESNNKYYCNLLGLQFRSGLHVYGVLEIPSVVASLSLLLNWRLKLAVVNICKRIKTWSRRYTASDCGAFCLQYSVYSAVSVRHVPSSTLKKPILLAVASCFCELYSIIKCTKTKFVLPGLSSTFARADCSVLPTGRNFFSKGVLNAPTPWAYSVSTAAVIKLLRAYYNRSCVWLKTVGISVWATANMRTGGDDIATVLRLNGVKPIWEAETFEVIGFEVLPLKTIRFPRVNVLVRLSGLFRDIYHRVVDRLYRVFEVLTCLNNAAGGGFGFEVAECDLFSSEPGLYGTGLQELLDSGNRVSVFALAKKYVIFGGYRYNGSDWENGASAFANALANVQVVLQSQDNREHDVLDSDDYYQFEGGMNAAVRCIRSKVCGYHIDTSYALKANIKVRRLRYEIDRVLRCKLLNKSWVLSTLGHGYRGAAEVVANLSYFCGFALTSFQTSGSQFMSIFNTLIADSSVNALIAASNKNALVDIKRKLLEVLRMGVWSPISNNVRFCLET
uniref:Aerobic cobaltochelatase subunit CobN n=1 Tax=Candidatus Hodgkinia cicadicola TaxID=573658 RepID=A0A097GZV0_9HYPH|nr:Aerobic cobaltochelatase subunit CobN [Candidatus Hodgkinia cicadicola]